MTQTLEQLIQQGVAQRRIWIDHNAVPLARLCSWCDATLELNYEQFTQVEMNRRISSWLAKHNGCYFKYCLAEEQV